MEAEARMATWSMNAAAVNCWSTDICVFDGKGSWSGEVEGREDGLLLWTIVVSWDRRLLASLRDLGERNISLQKSSLEERTHRHREP